MPALGDTEDIGFELPENCLLFTIGAFVQSCKEGSFNDFIGMGYYASKSRYYPSYRILCVDALAGRLDPSFFFVAWFGSSID